MIVSFAAVILITVSQASDSDEAPKHERLLFKDNDALAGLIGCICVIGTGIFNGVVSVWTRMLQHIEVAPTIFYLSSTALTGTLVLLLIEYAVSEEKSFRLFNLEIG